MVGLWAWWRRGGQQALPRREWLGGAGWDSVYVRSLRQYFASRDRLVPALHGEALYKGPPYAPPGALGPFAWPEGVKAWAEAVPRSVQGYSLYALFAAVFPEADSEGPWIDWQWESLLAAAETASGTAHPILFFVYDMPEEFTDVAGTEWPHSTEFLFHQWLEESGHRTRDPEKADYFFVPAYASIHSVGTGAVGAVEMLAAAQAYVAASGPFWDRRGGSDHVWLISLEEGACAAPRALRSSVLVDHAGALYGSDNVCRSAQRNECWAPRDWEPDGREAGAADARRFGPALGTTWGGPVAEHGDFPCFDPRKDVFLPPWRLEAPAPSKQHNLRQRLFTYVGDMGKRRPEWFSGGVRQRVAELWGGRSDLGMHLLPAGEGNFEAILEDSIFCGVFVGDSGWAAVVADYVRHGCIPVHIHDLNIAPYEGALDLARYSLRVAEVNITNLPYLLSEVPPERVAELQAGLAEVRGRFSYEAPAAPGAAGGAGGAPGAFGTLLEVLLARRLKPR